MLVGEDDRLAFVRYKGVIHLLCMPKWIWILDRFKWSDAWNRAGYEENVDATDRYGINVLDEGKIQIFLEKSNSFEVNIQELREDFKNAVNSDKSWWSVEHLIPKLYIDFDRKHLAACYSGDDGPKWEQFVPDGWNGEFINFIDEYDEDKLPSKYKFWVTQEGNLLRKLTF